MQLENLIWYLVQ